LTVTSPYLSATRRPPLTSTLFPYTTLFRSRTHPRRDILLCIVVVAGHACAGERLPHHLTGTLLLKKAAIEEHFFFAGPCGFHRRDRKSTRLNSSHVSISYAVFCLKKKNKHT